MQIDKNIKDLIETSEEQCQTIFKEIDDIELHNQLKVLDAFKRENVQAYHFIGTSGYGHNDIGKQKLASVFSAIFNTEDAIVSPLISCGTEAISQTLFGLLRPNDTMLCISGTPYDTLQNVIFGIKGKNIGSLKDYSINYAQVDLVNNDFDLPAVVEAVKKYNPKMVYIQRSRGYEFRNALTIDQIAKAIEQVKRISNANIVVDNCYGEFTEKLEPTDVGADIIVGSLIKNLGGGIAPTGGYIAGKKALIELISYKLTSPAVGVDSGSYANGYKHFFQGLFVAPHTVAQAKKLVALTRVAMSKLGYSTCPTETQPISDIVCAIKFNEPNKLIKFVQAIQAVSAVDSNSLPIPDEMEGYSDQIIMASGSFNQGSTIELSCDGPLRAPYTAYLQGCLSYTHGKIGLMNAIQALNKQ